MAALTGNYVNFGVFELYGDRALADALDIALKMILSIPLGDILTYRKVKHFYWMFIKMLNFRISCWMWLCKLLISNMPSRKQVKIPLPTSVLRWIFRLILLTISPVLHICYLRMINFRKMLLSIVR